MMKIFPLVWVQTHHVWLLKSQEKVAFQVKIMTLSSFYIIRMLGQLRNYWQNDNVRKSNSCFPIWNLSQFLVSGYWEGRVLNLKINLWVAVTRPHI